MNQILFNIKENKKRKNFFKIQFIISIVIALILIFYIIKSYNNNNTLEGISKSINKNMKLSSIYQTEKLSLGENYLGKIYIEKINLEYIVFNSYNDELLKIAPCKFYGKTLEETGNIAIAAHNYNDSRFFGRISELELKDTIKIKGLNGIEYEYIVFDVFETSENDMKILKNTKNYELTLLTCNNANKKRIIVKAYRKNA